MKNEAHISEISPSPDNDSLYNWFDPSNADDAALLEDIDEHGIIEPLAVTQDGVIVSGHRRYAACRHLGIETVPTITLPISFVNTSRDEWLKILRQHNLQREKTFSEILYEQVVQTSPEEAHQALTEYRAKKTAIPASAMVIHGEAHRSRITAAKQPMLSAVNNVLAQMGEYLPISLRSIHYTLLNDPPLIHASKPDSTYRNDRNSYAALSNLVTRARLAGFIPWDSVLDETRPTTLWDVHATPASFIRQEIDNCMRNYWRDLMQSQEQHIEILIEKKTLLGIVKPIAGKYTIPLTAGSGYCSITPRHEIASRFFKCGKSKLVVVVLSDLDPDGCEIAQSFARSMLSEFDLPADTLTVIRCAITPQQVHDMDLQTDALAIDKESKNRKKFIGEFGDKTYELEALLPAMLQAILRDTIDSVIDQEAFAHEREQEAQDAASIDEARQKVLLALQGV